MEGQRLSENASKCGRNLVCKTAAADHGETKGDLILSTPPPAVQTWVCLSFTDSGHRLRSQAGLGSQVAGETGKTLSLTRGPTHSQEAGDLSRIFKKRISLPTPHPGKGSVQASI